jgi:hypothetical protein
MSDLSYSDAGTVAPATAGPAGKSWFNIMFNYLFARINAHKNGTADQHDSQAILGHATLPLTTARTTAAQNQHLTNDMLAKAIGDVIGAPGFTGTVPLTLSSTSAVFAAATSAGTPTLLAKYDAAGGLQPAASTMPRSALKEFGAYAANPISTVVNYHGGYYADASRVAHFRADGTTSHAPPGTAGQERWDVVSINPSTGVVNVGLGVAAAIGSAAFPVPAATTDQVLYYANTKNGQVGIQDSYSATNGYIIPVPTVNFGGGGGGGGGTSGVFLTDPGLSWGTLGSFVELNALLNGTMASPGVAINGRRPADLRVTPYRIGSEDPVAAPNGPTLANLIIKSAGGMEMRPQDFLSFTAGTGNVIVKANTTLMFPNSGLMKTRATAITRTPSSGIPFGYSTWFIVADYAGVTDGQFDVRVDSSDTSNANATSKLLGIALYNNSGIGTAGFTGINYAAFEPLLQVSSTQMVPIQETYTTAAGLTAFTGVAGVPQEIVAARKTLQFPRTMRLEVSGSITVRAGTTGEVQAYYTVDNGAFFGPGANAYLGTGLSSGWRATAPLIGRYGDSSSVLNGQPAGFVAGSHVLSVWLYFANSGTYTVDALNWQSTQWGIFS